VVIKLHWYQFVIKGGLEWMSEIILYLVKLLFSCNNFNRNLNSDITLPTTSNTNMNMNTNTNTTTMSNSDNKDGHDNAIP
jgi:hypothetical protein